MEAAKLDGTYIDPNRGTVLLRDYWNDTYLPAKPRAHNTMINLEMLSRLNLLPALGDRTLASIRRTDLEQLQMGMLKGGLARSSVNERMIHVRAMFKHAHENKVITDNPTKGLKQLQTAGRAVNDDDLPTDEHAALIALHIEPKYRLSTLLMAGCGLRVGETMGVSADCPRDGFIRVYQQVTRLASQPGATLLSPLKHRVEGEYRDVPLAKSVWDAWELHCDTYGTLEVSGVKLLFWSPTTRNRVITANNYSHVFAKACIKAGLYKKVAGHKPGAYKKTPLYSPHSLRHYFASTALANGASLLEVSRWLGHKSIVVTADIYGHLTNQSPERCRQIVENGLMKHVQHALAA